MNRDNSLDAVESQFTQGLSIDVIAKKWPHLAIPLGDPSRYTSSQKKLVPLTRTIRANHFNALADAVVRLERVLADKAGDVYYLDGSGTSTFLGSASILTQVKAIWDTTYDALNIGLVKATVTGIADLAYSPDLISFYKQIQPKHWWGFFETDPLPTSRAYTYHLTTIGKVYKDTGFNNTPAHLTPQAGYPNGYSKSSSILSWKNERNLPAYGTSAFSPGIGNTSNITDMGTVHSEVPFSFSCLLRTNNDDHRDDDCFLSWGVPSDGGFALGIQGGQLFIYFFRSGSSQRVNVGTFNSTLPWFRLTFTLAPGGAYSAWFNSTLKVSGTLADSTGFIVPSVSPIKIPDMTGALQWTEGILFDDITMYDYVLSSRLAEKLHHVTYQYCDWNLMNESASTEVIPFNKTYTIPAPLTNSFYSNRSLGFVTSFVAKNYTDKSWWYKNYGTNVVDRSNQSVYLLTSSFLDNALANTIRLQASPIFMAPPVLTDRIVQWVVPTTNKTLPQFKAQPNPAFTGSAYKSSHPVFKTEVNSGLSPILGYSGVSGNLVLIQSTLNSSADPTLSSTPAPYLDLCANYGQCGGIFVSNRTDEMNFVDGGIEFTFHGYDISTETKTFLASNSGYVTKSGVFLRMSEKSNDLSSDLTINNVDYDAYSNYTGYLLRFNAAIVSAGADGIATDQAVQQCCIMKVENEQLAAMPGDMRFWWNKDQAEPPAENVWVSTTHTPALKDAPSGRIKVLKYFTLPFPSVIKHKADFSPETSGNWWVYRFRAVGSTLMVDLLDYPTYPPSSTAYRQWINILTVEDPDPIYPVDNAKYYPSGLYSKGVWGSSSSTDSGSGACSNILALSNISDHLYNDPTTSKRIDANIMVFKQSADRSVPGYS